MKNTMVIMGEFIFKIFLVSQFLPKDEAIKYGIPVSLVLFCWENWKRR